MDKKAKNFNRSSLALDFLLMGGVALCAFWPMLRFPFTDIDTWPLLLTSSFDSWSGLLEQFRQELLDGRMINARYYRPLVTISYGLDQLLWGLNPFGFHLTDLLIHWFNACGVVLLFRVFFGDRHRTFALFAGFLFVIHPLQVENVPAIARRAEILSGTFLWLSTYFFLKDPRRWKTCTLSALCYGLGLLCKESVIVLPLIFFGTCLFCLTPDPAPPTSLKKRLRANLPGALRAQIPFLIVTGFYFLLRWRVLGEIGGYSEKASWIKRFAQDFVGHPLGLFFSGLSSLWPKVLDGFLSLDFAKGFFLTTLLLLAVLLFFHLRLQRLFSSGEKKQERGVSWWSALSGTAEQTRWFLVFLAWFFSVEFFFLLYFGFNFRYLYAETFFLALFLASCLGFFSTVTWKKDRWQNFAWGGAYLLIVGNLVLGSPLFSRRALRHWQEDGELAQEIFQQIAEFSGTHEATPQTFFLVNFPYQRINHSRTNFLTIPLSIITLEHAVQAYVDLHHPHNQINIVGLSYLYLQNSPEPLQIDTSFSEDHTIHVRVLRGGNPTPLPWKENYGARNLGKIYQAKRPSKDQKDQLRIQLTEAGIAQPRPVFFLYDGSEDLEILHDPFALPLSPAFAQETL